MDKATTEEYSLLAQYNAVVESKPPESKTTAMPFFFIYAFFSGNLPSKASLQILITSALKFPFSIIHEK